MNIVADTNTFLAVALAEPERDYVIEVTTGHELVAPEVVPFEIGNALSAMLKRGVLGPHQVAAAWDATQQIPVDLRPVDIRSALSVAGRFHVYAYDAYFLECALRLRAPLLSLDRGLKGVARQLNIDVVGDPS